MSAAQQRPLTSGQPPDWVLGCVQDARKGVLFDSFPPVLQLQLKRFEYDFQRDMMVKVGKALRSSI